MDISPVADLVNKSKELSDESDSLRRALDELTMLNDLSLSISGTIDTNKIMDSIIDRAICFIGAEQGNIVLIREKDEGNTEMLVKSTCSSKELSTIGPQENILGWIESNQKPLRVNDPQVNTKYIDKKNKRGLKSILSVPLMVRSQLIGVLSIYNKKNSGSFTKQDEQLLSIIGSQSAQVLENARLNEKEQRLNEIEKEVEVANKIQGQLLPDEAPLLKQYNLLGKNITAKTVGGDYYDFIKLDDHRWVICLGDVSGKGLPASLLMSNLQALIRGELPCHSEIEVLLENVNNKLFQNTSNDKFATLFVGILNLRSHSFTYSNAGHEYPFLIHTDKSFDRLMKGGVPLGVMENQKFESETIKFIPGDKLVIYSDGLIDSRDKRNEEYGEKRLQRLLLKAVRNSSSELIDNIFNDSTKHSQQSNLFDDMTAVVLSRTE
ncbi:GAF domain-containing SpoIIE family protein phosphatase [Fodinibius saliphilus]|uniref:GAF domain-containing SpoIIE family protein phosphatase n=1 Tax=Fodinibius saliphilus TaxID=1920650 RepID=UPI001108C52C|nr:GAF domain-containing SpoIIE family protein phosphatase [Fodinibius saliphilus]